MINDTERELVFQSGDRSSTRQRPAPKVTDDRRLAAIHAAQADALPRCRARSHHETHVRQ
jgi:hypothetical protein